MNIKAKSIIDNLKNSTMSNLLRGGCEIIINSPLWEVNNPWIIGMHENNKIESRRELNE